MIEHRETRMIRRFDIRKIRSHESERVIDCVAVEEPLQIYLQYQTKGARRTEPVAAVMRTPGADRELAVGYLLSEGVLSSQSDVMEVRHLGADTNGEIVVSLSDRVDVDDRRLQRGLVGASCGYCGRRSAEISATPRIANTDFAVKYSDIHAYSRALDACQSGFSQTGGLHAAALIGVDGNIEGAFEDVGRHNALDKLLGAALLEGRLPLSRSTVFLSSRSSFELVHKAATAGVPILATLGGPSSLAVELARECGITLAGFVRNGSMNVYSGEWRLHSES